MQGRAVHVLSFRVGVVVLKNTGVLRGAAARARRLERGTVLGGVLGGCWCDPAVRPATGPEWCVPIGAVGAMLGGSRSVLGAESVVVSVRRPGQGRTAREAAGGAARGASSHRSGEHGQQAARGVPAKSGSSDSEVLSRRAWRRRKVRRGAQRGDSSSGGYALGGLRGPGGIARQGGARGSRACRHTSRQARQGKVTRREWALSEASSGVVVTTRSEELRRPGRAGGSGAAARHRASHCTLQARHGRSP